MVGTYCMLVPVRALGRLGRSRKQYLPQSAVVQANLEGIHAIIHPMCENLQKMSGGFLSLQLAQVQPKVMMLLVITIIYATDPRHMEQCPSPSTRCNHRVLIMQCMRMLLYLGKSLRHRDSCTSRMNLCPPISYTYISGISKLVVQIYRMDAIFMRYRTEGQVGTMMSSVMYKSDLSMGEKSLVGYS